MSSRTRTALRMATLVQAAISAIPAHGGEFKFKLNYFASDTGYFEVEGYPGVQPELTMVVGETYIFNQSDPSNWYHPLGFAYYPDGAHEGVDEIEDPGSLVYKIDGVMPEENLDGYEPEFFFPRDHWLTKEYHVELTITPEVLAKVQGDTIFAFCHIHNRMSLPIRLVNPDGTPIDWPSAKPSPALYAQYEPDPFDGTCGTFEASKYESACADNYLCSAAGAAPSQFARCMQAIDCKMVEEMRVQEAAESPTATFMHQMIPHHENAVNMAKVLLRHGGELDEEVNDLMVTIINSQNAQITFMKGWLRDNSHPEFTAVRCDSELLEDTDGGATSAAGMRRASLAYALVAAAAGGALALLL